PMDLVRIIFGVSTEGTEVGPGEVHFDLLNGGVPEGSWCKASTLVDDFDDGVQAHAWARSYADDTCTISELGGELVVDLANGTFGYCAYVSAASYDLTGDAILVKVPTTPNPATEAETYFRAVAQNDDYVETILSNGELTFYRKIGGVSTTFATALYSPTNHA